MKRTPITNILKSGIALTIFLSLVSACSFGQEAAPAAAPEAPPPTEVVTEVPAAPVEATAAEAAEAAETPVEESLEPTAEPTEAAIDPAQEFMAMAEATVVAATRPANIWSGPTSGPAATPGRLVALVASDGQDSRVARLRDGVLEAAAAIGWQVQVLDGQGDAAARTAALNQALALQPAGIILAGVGAAEQAAGLEQAAAAGIPVVGWQAAAESGPLASPPLFANVTMPATAAAELVALYAVVESAGQAGVVIFTDSALDGAAAQVEAMTAVIEQCAGCTLLSVQEVPLAEASAQMPPLLASLAQEHGQSWGYALAVHDGYFDTGSSAGPAHTLATGPGSGTAYQRIREGQLQSGTVPEPLNLYGWQLVDELNRALAGEAWSGFIAPAHLLIAQNLEADGGPNNLYDPDNGYRELYLGIWAGGEQLAGEADGQPAQPQ